MHGSLIAGGGSPGVSRMTGAETVWRVTFQYGGQSRAKSAKSAKFAKEDQNEDGAWKDMALRHPLFHIASLPSLALLASWRGIRAIRAMETLVTIGRYVRKQLSF